MLAPPPLPRVSAPVSGKFWIHHWIVWSIVCEGPSGGVTAADTTTSWHDPSSFYVILISLFDFQASNQHRIFAVLLLSTSTLRSVRISTSRAHRFLSMDFRRSRLEISSSWMDYHYGRHCSFLHPAMIPPPPTPGTITKFTYTRNVLKCVLRVRYHRMTEHKILCRLPDSVFLRNGPVTLAVYSTAAIAWTIAWTISCIVITFVWPVWICLLCVV